MHADNRRVRKACEQPSGGTSMKQLPPQAATGKKAAKKTAKKTAAKKMAGPNPRTKKKTD
jgi:hypothetical protein